MTQYVWYASYGSNINRDRFLCYIRGGKPFGSTVTEVGCKDPTLPVAEEIFTIPYPLYFAKSAGRWRSMGVAFIDSEQKSNEVTYSKKYLITTDQFLDVLKQENSGIEIDLNLQKVKSEGCYTFRKQAWYGTILYLGEDKGYPIYTFTAPWNMNEITVNKPSHEYLQTIITGLKEYHSGEVIYQYFKDKPGISGIYTDKELTELVFS
ncbi:hypothetical protein [Fredinandcohnia sp. 179-A 10B2 NHS]|uniref:hypothetical protein n=1 Tax=Fredinandcohnia sp. 179-A 10B2 NHS TaxID=3235176 RepID=UPI0039A35735